MLKTLRITSLIAVVLAVCGVLFIVYLGLKKDPDIIAYLDDPGVIGVFKNKAATGDSQDLESPLVVQAHEFALRINPPPPPKPVVTETAPKPVAQRDPVVQREVPKPPPPPPPPPTSAKFTLLATVLCEANPSRSMVLLRQAGKDEWFWQGEKVGQLEVEEVRNGSAVFSQNGRNKQELFVPVKTEVKSLLKDATASTRQPSGPGSITTQLGETLQEADTAAAADAASGPTAGPAARDIRVDRSRGASTSTAAARQDASTSIRRVRTVPVPPTPEEQRESLQESISSIQEIMSRDDTGASDEQRQQENETWMRLLEVLQSEKEKVEVLEKTEETPAEPVESADAEDVEPPVTETPPVDPNEE